MEAVLHLCVVRKRAGSVNWPQWIGCCFLKRPYVMSLCVFLDICAFEFEERTEKNGMERNGTIRNEKLNEKASIGHWCECERTREKKRHAREVGRNTYFLVGFN